MSNINGQFLIDLGLVLGSLAITCRLVLFRINHKAFLKNNKPGTPNYEARMKVMRPYWLIGSSLVALLFILKLFNVARAIAMSNAPDRYFVLVIVPLAALLVFGLIFYVGYNLFIKTDKK